MKKYLISYKNKIILLILIGLGLIFFLDKALAVGLLFVLFLFLVTFLILLKIGIKDKELYLVLLITLLIHLAVVLFIYYTEFKPFGGGADYEGYNQTAIEIAQRFKQGNFSLQGLHFAHYFPLVIGIIYAINLPEMIVGQLFTVWLAAISVLFTYLIVRELSSSKKWAFLIGLIVAIYPSYLYFGSLLLKDTLVVPFVLTGLFLSLKMLKNFSWRNFLFFYIILTGTIHLRFYVGYALLFSFILCWFVISTLNLKKRVIYGIIVILLLGLSPQVLGYGYYGIKTLNTYLNPETITVYREVVYAPSSPEISGSGSASLGSGLGSSFVVETGFEKPSNFVISYLQTFSYSLLGPFPWQIRYKRQLFTLLETIPWYFLLSVIILNLAHSIKARGVPKTLRRYRFSISLLIFSLMSLGALSLFITNFGIITRIRIPSFIALLCLVSFNHYFNEPQE